MNLIRGRRPLPNPCDVALGDCLTVDPITAEIQALNPSGERIVRVLRLDSRDAVDLRRKWLGILRSTAVTDEELFREFVGYPNELPDLAHRQEPRNSRPDGVNQSAHKLRITGELPDWY